MSTFRVFHRSCRSIALGALVGCLTFSAFAQEESAPSIRLISPELFTALEQHGESDVTLEEVVQEQFPEVIYHYAETIQDRYRGSTADEVFAEAYPESHEAYLAATGSEAVEDSADFIAFVMGHEDSAYADWQESLGDGAFRPFVEATYPDIVAVAEEQAITPAERGLSMREHVQTLGDDSLVAELDGVFDSIGSGNGEASCHCWTVGASLPVPSTWEVETLDAESKRSGFAPKKYQMHSLYTAGLGAGKHFNFIRKSRHTVHQVDRDRHKYDTRFQVRMHCTRNGERGGVECGSESGCSAELALRVAYASKVYEQVDVGGPWSRNSKMRTTDVAVLRHDPPGPAGEQLLFNKGIGVAGNVSTGWNAGAGLTLLQSGAQVVLNVVDANTPLSNLLEGDLLDETYNGILGLIERQGSEGSLQKEMSIAFDTSNGSAPFSLPPNTTLAFDLDTTSDFYSRGYGGTSESWGSIDSSHYVAAVARNYVCPTGTSYDGAKAFWVWSGSSNAPHSSSTLQSLVKNWITVELGTVPSGTASNQGEYP